LARKAQGQAAQRGLVPAQERARVFGSFAGRRDRQTEQTAAAWLTWCGWENELQVATNVDLVFKIQFSNFVRLCFCQVVFLYVWISL